MNRKKWLEWRINALNEENHNDENDALPAEDEISNNYLAEKKDYKCLKCHSPLDFEGSLGAPGIGNSFICKKCDKSYIEIGGQLYDPEEYRGAEPPWIQSGYDVIEESFHHLSSESKIGLALREMNKRVSLIEKYFMRANESRQIDEAQLENWVKTYKSLSNLNERINSLLKVMKGEL